MLASTKGRRFSGVQIGSRRTAIAAVAMVGISLSGQTPKPVEWTDYAGGPDGSRYVALDQMNKSNVDKIDVAWTYPYAGTGFNPIVAHGIIYTTARTNALVAIDATTGKEIWIHPELTGMTRRGVNYWESKDGKDRRLIFCLADYMQELDANTGKFIRSFGQNGAVDLRDAIPDRDPKLIHLQSNSPGRVFENLILLGSATGEGYFSAPGDFRAYDIVSGKLVWTFHTVPRPGEYGYDSFPKDAYKYIGGNNTWGEITVDEKRGIAYFPTGSPTFDFYGADRHGNGLFGDCLIAIDARTGKRLWHFQAVHHDLWDYDNTAAPMLTTITQNGKKRDVVAMAGKTGFLYVFDRVTGDPIWPINEKPVATKTDVVGEQVSPTQPIPSLPPPFISQKFTPDDVDPYIMSTEQRALFKDRVATDRNDGLFTPIGFSEVVHMPGNQGGANWGSTSSNPNDGTVYVIGYNMPALMRLLKPGEGRSGGAGAGARGASGASGGGGRAAAAQSAGATLYLQNCAGCHGPDRTGSAASHAPTLVNIAARLSAKNISDTITEGRGQMPGFHALTSEEIDQLVTFLDTADRPAGGRGRGAAPVYEPGPVAETGPATTREGGTGRGRGASATDYPAGVDHPDERYTMDGYGLYPGLAKPPYTSLTAYDLNKGTIKWQIGLGDDYRVTSKGGPKGTGAASDLKGGVISTSGGLVFVNAGDRRLHIYDAATGKELRTIPLGETSSGSPSMYELKGKQYLLVTSSGRDNSSADPNETGPSGLIAFELKGDAPAPKK